MKPRRPSASHASVSCARCVRAHKGNALRAAALRSQPTASPPAGTAAAMPLPHLPLQLRAAVGPVLPGVSARLLCSVLVGAAIAHEHLRRRRPTACRWHPRTQGPPRGWRVRAPARRRIDRTAPPRMRHATPAREDGAPAQARGRVTTLHQGLGQGKEGLPRRGGAPAREGGRTWNRLPSRLPSCSSCDV